MKVYSKFLTLIFACTLVSTPKIESKVTLNGALTGISMVSNLGNLCLLSCFMRDENGNYLTNPLVQEIIITDPYVLHEAIIAGPISVLNTYCLLRKTESNTFTTLANGFLSIYNTLRAINAHNKHTSIDNSWANTLGLAFETDKNEYASSRIRHSFAALYYALVAYQLNK